MSNLISILDEALVADLRSAVAGDVITATDADYDAARGLWNGAVRRRPAVVVRATATDDVATAIATAREHGLPLSVRGGGHHVTGAAVVDDGLVIDLSGMDAVAIDPEARTARVGPGARASRTSSDRRRSTAWRPSPARRWPAASAGSGDSSGWGSTTSARSNS